MEKPFNLAFIGGAVDSAVGYAHHAACKMDNRWKIVAGAFSRKVAINEETAKVYGVSLDRAYPSWNKLLEEEAGKIDAVAVLTPTPTHAEVVVACLGKGLPVICEKSLSSTVHEAEEILNARDKEKGFLAVTYNYSGYPMVRELRDMIRRGVLGTIFHFQAEMPQEGYQRVNEHGEKPKPQDWRLQDGEIPTIHLDLGVHVHHILHYLTGEHPESVVADQRSYGWFDVMDNVTCLCKYTGDIQGQIWYSKSALGHRNGLRFRIYGSEASAEWYQMNPEEVLLSYKDGRKQVLDRASTVHITNQQRYNRFKAGHPSGFVEAFSNLYSDIADSLEMYNRTGTWHNDEVFSADFAAEGLRTLFAMVQSSKQNSWVSVRK